MLSVTPKDNFEIFFLFKNLTETMIKKPFFLKEKNFIERIFGG